MLSDSPWVSLMGMLLSVGVVAILAYLFTKYVAGRHPELFSGVKASGENLRLIGCLSLGRSQKIAVVEAAQEYYLLGVTERSITLLEKLPREAGEALKQQPEESGSGDFQQALKELLQRKDRGGKK